MEAAGGAALGTFCQTPGAPGWERFDLASAARHPEAAAKLLDQTRPWAACIAAGATHVDRCEDERDWAFAANAHGPAAVARACAAAGVRVAFFSTEYVFDGQNGPYGETSAVNPLSVYGAAKLAGERAVAEACPEALIVRTTVVYGPERQGKNAAYQILRRLCGGQDVQAPSDQVTTPTYNRDLAAAVLGLLRRGAAGVVHVAGPEVMDRAAFARLLATLTGHSPARVHGVTTASLRQKAPRPLRAGLLTARLTALLPAWHGRGAAAAVADWIAHPAGLPWPVVA